MRNERGIKRGGCGGLRASDAGFSLLELLIVIGALLIVGAFAAPALFRAVRRSQSETTARNIAGILRQARSEAVKRNKRIGTAFASGAGNNSDIYGIDENGNGTIDATEPRVMAMKGMTFWNGNTPAAPPVTNLPVDYSTFTVPPLPGAQPPATQGPTPLTAYNIVFSPQGTVVVFQGGEWVLAPQVQGFSVTDAVAIGAGDTDSYLITITPAGNVRMFTWQNGVGWVAH